MLGFLRDQGDAAFLCRKYTNSLITGGEVVSQWFPLLGLNAG